MIAEGLAKMHRLEPFNPVVISAGEAEHDRASRHTFLVVWT